MKEGNIEYLKEIKIEAEKGFSRTGDGGFQEIIYLANTILDEVDKK